jgi:hypothetical protein
MRNSGCLDCTECVTDVVPLAIGAESTLERPSESRTVEKCVGEFARRRRIADDVYSSADADPDGVGQRAHGFHPGRNQDTRCRNVIPPTGST